MTYSEFVELYEEYIAHLADKDNSDSSFVPTIKTYQSHNITQDEWNTLSNEVLALLSDTVSINEFVQNIYAYINDISPEPPTTAGTYTLKVTVDSDGNATYSWVSD